MAANLRLEQLGELQLAFPTFTEALGMAAQQLVRTSAWSGSPLAWPDRARVTLLQRMSMSG